MTGWLLALMLATALFLLLPMFSRAHAGARALVISVTTLFVLRYVWWRATETLPSPALTMLCLWQWGFFFTELLALVYTLWTSFTFIWRTDRTAQATLCEQALRRIAPERLPVVDVFIATYNEPGDILEPTIRGALSLDYPHVRVHVLDDSRREWLRQLCATHGVNHITRPDNSHGKAGNLNHALQHTNGELILFLDADFIPMRSFLRRTVGLLLSEPTAALVQTPQHYDNPDPIQHNLSGEAVWTEEQRYFFDVAQPSRDAWGNAFCVGTGFLCKRAAFRALGGYPLECITEDLYLSYVLKSHGWRTLYLNEFLCFGLATERLAEYIGQRVRWCQGTVQTLFLRYGPVRAPGLSLIDRLFYFDVLLYWLTFPMLLLTVVAPLVFWSTGMPVFHCRIGDAYSYILPRIVAGLAAGYWLSQGRVMPIVTELKKMITVFHVLPGMVIAFLFPEGRTFKVTSKGDHSDRVVVQWPLMWPFLGVGALNLLGMILTMNSSRSVVQWDDYAQLNFAFGLYSAVMMGLCCLACVELPKDSRYWNRNQPLRGSFTGAMKTLWNRVWL